jgi:hypothetical protein
MRKLNETYRIFLCVVKIPKSPHCSIEIKSITCMITVFLLLNHREKNMVYYSCSLTLKSECELAAKMISKTLRTVDHVEHESFQPLINILGFHSKKVNEATLRDVIGMVKLSYLNDIFLCLAFSILFLATDTPLRVMVLNTHATTRVEFF